jgi:hypothetical protein
MRHSSCPKQIHSDLLQIEKIRQVGSTRFAGAHLGQALSTPSRSTLTWCCCTADRRGQGIQFCSLKEFLLVWMAELVIRVVNARVPATAAAPDDGAYRCTQRMMVVWAIDRPRSAIISTRSRKLSLERRYHLTHSTMISRSKWRPSNSSSKPKNPRVESGMISLYDRGKAPADPMVSAGRSSGLPEFADPGLPLRRPRLVD